MIKKLTVIERGRPNLAAAQAVAKRDLALCIALTVRSLIERGALTNAAGRIVAQQDTRRNA